ncbi:MAG: helix-turn-helix domain-containing protein [Candidatus Kapaibacterium sp.]|jgi:excisionase family DNA binding protein
MPKQIGNLTLYDLEELSVLLNITVFSLREYIKKGKLKAQKMGKRYFITQESLNEYFSNNEQI